MSRERTRHKNISVEQIAQLEEKGLIHAGFDPQRDREIFHRAIADGCTANPKKLACEFVNTSKYDLIIAHEDGIRKIRFNADSIVYMPHGYEGWQVQHRDGSPYQGPLLVNYGDQMKKGNKLPSRPEVSTKVYRRSN